MKNIFVLFMITGLISGCATNSADIKEREGDVFAMVSGADSAYNKGDWKSAEKGYRAVVARVPNDGYAYFRLGNTLAKQYQFDDAAKAYQEALLRDAQKTKIYNNLAMIHLLQAETVLTAGLDTMAEKNGNTAQVKHMLLQLKKITRVRLKEVKSPINSSN